MILGVLTAALHWPIKERSHLASQKTAWWTVAEKGLHSPSRDARLARRDGLWQSRAD
jgi:hypothetical protein